MKKAGDLLSTILDEDTMKKARTYSGFFSSWEKVTQEAAIAAASEHSHIVELDRHIIMVEADHPGWIQLLQTKQNELLKAVRQRFPELSLSGISFRLCRDPSAFKGQSDATSSVSIGPAQSINPVGEDKAGNADDPVSKSQVSNTDSDPHDKEFTKALKQLEKTIQSKNKGNIIK